MKPIVSKLFAAKPEEPGQLLAKFAYVGGSYTSTMEDPGRNLTRDPYYTDGLRLVMWIASEPQNLQDIAYEDWSDPEG